MPFQETHVMDERRRFVRDVDRSLLSFAELCRRYGISRKTGYKWLRRWETGGPDSLATRSSRPERCPWATPERVTEAILAVRRAYPDYGAKKIIWFLERNRADLPLPSRTTVHNILCRRGLVAKRRRTMRRWHPGQPTAQAPEPNSIWTIDFKGQFRTRDGVECFPLTVQDMHSRFLLACHGLPNTSLANAKPVLRRLFREFGLPDRIRSDNGTPFASNALGRLSRLSVWFIRLGIIPEFIEPACPHQNGKHENMHLVLKRQATRPPRANLRAQQRTLNAFRTEYNSVRPHEALQGAVPADLYRPSPRSYSHQLTPITYPPHFEVRRVSTNGGIRWQNHWINVSSILAEQVIGFEPVDAGLLDVYFGPIWLGRLVEAKGQIIDHLDRPKRRKGGNHRKRKL